VRAGPERPQQRQRSLDRVGARHPPPLDSDQIRRQREADGGDTRGSARLRSVCHETVCGIGLVQEVRERVTLQRVQPRFTDVCIESGENIVNGKKETVQIRSSTLFRKENGAWKVIGHQTDPLGYMDEPKSR
jgi:hypothetical protein